MACCGFKYIVIFNVAPDVTRVAHEKFGDGETDTCRWEEGLCPYKSVFGEDFISTQDVPVQEIIWKTIWKSRNAKAQGDISCWSFPGVFPHWANTKADQILVLRGIDPTIYFHTLQKNIRPQLLLNSDRLNFHSSVGGFGTRSRRLGSFYGEEHRQYKEKGLNARYEVLGSANTILRSNQPILFFCRIQRGGLYAIFGLIVIFGSVTFSLVYGGSNWLFGGKPLLGLLLLCGSLCWWLVMIWFAGRLYGPECNGSYQEHSTSYQPSLSRSI